MNKRAVIEGFLLALVLIILNKVFYININNINFFVIVISYALVNLLFLTKNNLNDFLITGCTGLGVLIVIDLIFSHVFARFLYSHIIENYSVLNSVMLYFFGFIGSIIGTGIAVTLTATGVGLKIKTKIFSQSEVFMEKKLKLKLLGYLLLSAVGFSYFVLPQRAGISVPVFVILQAVCLYLTAPKKKPLLMLIPVFILSLNSFTSGNEMWRVPNLIVSALLYSITALMMSGRFRIKNSSAWFLGDVFKNLAAPLSHFELPVKWCAETNKEHTQTAKRVFIGIAISIPCLIFLLIMLSSADEIFSQNVTDFFDSITALFNFSAVLKIIIGFFIGFYLFGLIYSTYVPKEEKIRETKIIKGDLIVLNILLVSILAIYTIFVIIQFKYLFANSNNLPYGLTHTYYARRGFFELLFLTGLNIFLILITSRLTRNHVGKWFVFTKSLCCYLCAVTIILLISSFYRMYLYNADDGLTRLRFLVFGFLIFEAVGLIFTFFYILKPKFNIISVYSIIALTYYLFLNVYPMDHTIAKSQVDRYFDNGKAGIEYALTLSPDAAPQIARLLDSDDLKTASGAHYYFVKNNICLNDTEKRWHRWNLSIDRFNELIPK